MPVTEQEMRKWCETLLAGRAAAPDLTLADYLRAIPGLAALEGLPSGTPVLVRGDVDCQAGRKHRRRRHPPPLDGGHAAIRRKRGWKQIVFGHIGRKPEGSLAKVAKRLGRAARVRRAAHRRLARRKHDDDLAGRRARQIAAAKPGAVIMLENTRKYEIERVLWKAKPDDLPATRAEAREARQRVRREAGHGITCSKPSRPAASMRAPSPCRRRWSASPSGEYVAHEFAGPMMRCLDAQLVVFSGLKIDKLDDLEAMIDRGKIIARVRRRLAGDGAAQGGRRSSTARTFASASPKIRPTRTSRTTFPAERIEQAKRMIAEGREKGIEFVLPVDSVIEDGSVVEELKPGDQQFDIGPKTSELFEREVGEFIEIDRARSRSTTACSACSKTRGSKRARGDFMPQLKRMTDARRRSLHRRRRRRHGPRKIRRGKLGDPRLHRRRHGAQRPRRRTGAVSGGAANGSRPIGVRLRATRCETTN